MTDKPENEFDEFPIRYTFWETVVGFKNQRDADIFVGLCKKRSEQAPARFSEYLTSGFWRPLEFFEMRGAGYDLATNNGQIWVK